LDIISTWNEIGKPDFVKIGLQFPGNEPINSIPWEEIKFVKRNKLGKNLKIFEISGRNSLLNFYVEIVHNIYSTLYNRCYVT